MEGLLWKWTNYWNGWQTRWFVLNDGILAYYNSKDEVGQGCKGSMKVSACEIIVHPVDCSRMDVVIPGEQHMYLKAPSAPERQRWLVALGSSKACLNTSGPRRNSESSSPDSLKHKKSELRLYCDLLMQQAHMVKEAACKEKPPDVQKLEEATTLLSATCDSFIETLEACSKLANENFQFELPIQHTNEAVIPPTLAKSNKMPKPNASS